MIDEDELEQYCINLFKEDGWSYLNGYTIAPEEPDALRSDYREVALLPRLLEAVQRLNPTLPPATFEEVARTATKLSEPTLRT
jgi:type I restriction enzyme, R subunit